VVAALAGAGVLWGKRVLDSAGRLTNPGAADGWRSVTVALPPEQVAPGGRYPGPLAELGEAVEVRISPAPGGRGTELAARPASGARSAPSSGAPSGPGGENPAAEIRAALRRSRMLLETGEILHNRPVPHGRRPRTPAGWLVDEWEERARRKGNW
jgi:hypothetical protein